MGGTVDTGQKLQITGSAIITTNFEAGNTGGNVSAGDLTVDSTSTASKVIIGRLSATGSDNTILTGRNRVGATGWTIDSFGAATFGSSIAIGNSVAGAIAAPSTHKVSILIGGVQYYLLASNV